MIGAVIQARVSSTRLPGKVLKPIMNMPMLERQIQRLKKAKSLDRFCLATSDQAEDAPLADVAKRQGIEFYRGSLNDVLDRFYQAARLLKCESIVRITGDCPLIDASVVDQVIEFFKAGHFDYASNTLKPSFPDGLDVEVMSFAALEKNWKEAILTSEREHVTPYLYKHPELFKLGSYEGKENLSQLRWTVDDEGDFHFVEKVYEMLGYNQEYFAMNDILNLIQEHPELLDLNKGHARNEGYAKSLAREQTKK